MDIKEFSEKVAETKTELYSIGNQSNLSTIKSQYFSGTCGEDAFEKYLISIGTPIVKKYCTYVKKNPTFDADIVTEDVDYHVKTCPEYAVRNKWGISWTFQYSKERKDPLLINPKDRDVVALVIEKEKGKVYEILGTYKATDMLEKDLYKFDDTIDSYKMKGQKLFLHWNKISNLGIVDEKHIEIKIAE